MFKKAYDFCISGASNIIRKSENFAHLKSLINIALKQLQSAHAVPYYLNELVEG